MPALNAGMIALRQGRNVDLAAAIRDAHTLASGSALLGEKSAAAALRRIESELASPQAKRDVQVIAEQLTLASVALSAWLPGRSGPDAA
jgi:HPt (histidine-containing phosphotransfer) domain-containing protein